MSLVRAGDCARAGGSAIIERVAPVVLRISRRENVMWNPMLPDADHAALSSSGHRGQL
jgi:hypothetical protein